MDEVSREVVDAVYSYIQAVRSLGRTTVNSVDIADALDIEIQEAENAMRQLKDRGVRIRRWPWVSR